MNDKVLESIQYLKQCSVTEEEAYQLYESLSKKINQPESSFILALGYNCQKNSKVLQAIISVFEPEEIENRNIKKNLVELAAETKLFAKKIGKINNLDYLTTVEILKELITLEDTLGGIYKTYQQSNIIKNLVEELSKSATVNLDNFKKLFDSFMEEKIRHRGTLVEVMYSLEVKETENHRKITPLVKYQNPDTWNRESTIHSFTNLPVSENAQ